MVSIDRLAATARLQAPALPRPLESQLAKLLSQTCRTAVLKVATNLAASQPPGRQSE